MVDKKFYLKFRRILSISSLGAICCSQVVYASNAGSLRSMNQECRNILVVLTDARPADDHLSFEGRDKVKYRKISETKYGNSNERTITLEYEDSRQPLIEVILWDIGNRILILPSNPEISKAIDQFWLKRSYGLKPKINVEDIAWNHGSAAFAESLKNQIDKEKENEERERQKKNEENKKRQEQAEREFAIKVAWVLGGIGSAYAIVEIYDFFREI